MFTILGYYSKEYQTRDRATSIAGSMVFGISSHNQISYQHIETPGSVGTKGEGMKMSRNILRRLTRKFMTLGGYRAIEETADYLLSLEGRYGFAARPRPWRCFHY